MGRGGTGEADANLDGCLDFPRLHIHPNVLVHQRLTLFTPTCFFFATDSFRALLGAEDHHLTIDPKLSSFRPRAHRLSPAVPCLVGETRTRPLADRRRRIHRVGGPPLQPPTTPTTPSRTNTRREGHLLPTLQQTQLLLSRPNLRHQILFNWCSACRRRSYATRQPRRPTSSKSNWIPRWTLNRHANTSCAKPSFPSGRTTPRVATLIIPMKCKNEIPLVWRCGSCLGIQSRSGQRKSEWRTLPGG